MKKKIVFINRDNTMVKSKSGGLFPKDADDLVLLDNVKMIIERMLDDDFHFVITTNQGGIAKGTTTREIQEAICTGVINLFDEKHRERFSFFIGEDSQSPLYKPNREVLQEIAKDGEIDLLSSLVIGDTKSDEDFAKNNNLPFKLANKFFKQPECITVLVGFPSCGKTIYCREFHPFDMRVCIDDIIKSVNADYRIDWKRIYYDIEKKLIVDAISNKLNVVIDRTNIDAKRRKRFIDIAQQYKKEREQQTQKPMELKIICKYFKTELETSKNIYRKINNIPEEK
ncbi:AAA family ATPase, partial [bacterium]|nr:AAA family ATPase [bacterium]